MRRRFSSIVVLLLLATLLVPGPSSGLSLPSLGGFGGWLSDLFDDSTAEAVPPSYSSLVTNNSAALYWRLHESSGSVVNDSSGFARNGVFGTGVSKGQTGLISGDSNRALKKTTAAGAAATATGTSGLPAGNAPRTIELWFSSSDTSVLYPNLLTVGDFRISGALPLVSLTGAGAASIAADEYRDGRKHLLTGTFDGSTAILYVDGVEVTRGPLSLSTPSTQNVTVGESPNTTFDEVAVYPAALTPAQVNANWTAGGATGGACASAAAGRYSSAVLADSPSVYYRLGENPSSSFVAYDSSGNCRNGAFTRHATTAPGLIAGDGNAAITKTSSVKDEAMWTNGSWLPTGNSARTMEVWISGIESTQDRYVGVVEAGGFRLEVDHVFGVRLLGASGSAIPAVEPAGGNTLDGRRHLLTATFSGSLAILYIDGVEVSRGTLTLSTPPGHNLVMQSNSSLVLDDIAVYPTALSPARINAHWTAGASQGPACSSSGGGYASSVIGDAPLAYYRLGEDPSSSPVAYDVSGNCRNGAYTGFATQAPAVIEGDPDAAVMNNTALNETALRSANGSDLPAGAAPRSLEIWGRFVPRPGPDYPLLIGLGDFAIKLNWSHARLDANGDDIYIGTDNMRIGLRHLFTATYDGTTAKLYVDGALKASIPIALNTPVGSQLQIGSDYQASALDEAAVYNYALNPEQIANRARLGLRGTLDPDELNGGNNPAMECLGCPYETMMNSMGYSFAIPAVLDPVVVSTGNFTEPFQDLIMPGRGVPASVERTYNSAESSRDGLFGLGWSSNIGMRMEWSIGNPLINAMVTIRQENGSVARFTQKDGVFTAPSLQATLTREANGNYTFVRQKTDTSVFEPSGRLIERRDVNGYATTLSYPSPTQIVVRDRANRTITLTVDADGRATRAVDAANREIVYGYVGAELRTVTSLKANPSDATPTSWQFGYDPVTKKLTNVTNPRGHQMTNAYYPDGRVQYQIGYDNVRSDLSYSGVNPTTVDVTAPTNNASGTRPVTRYEFTNLLMTSRIDGFGTADAAEWTYEYDPLVSGLTKVIDPNLQEVMIATYDPVSAKMLTVQDVLTRRTTYTYTTLNNVRTSTDNAGVVTTFEYGTYADRNNDNGPLLLEVCKPLAALPPAGQTISCSTGGVTKQRIQYDYTDGGNPADVRTMTHSASKLWQYEYDAYGLRKAVIDPLTNKTTYQYDNVGRIQNSVAPKGYVSGNTVADYTTTFATNAFGDVRQITDPLGQSSSRTFDRNRNVDLETDANSNPTDYVYDEMNRVTQVVRPDTTSLRNEYWPDGSLRKQIDGASVATEYGYDSLGRTTTVKDPNNRTTTFGYDRVNNLKSKQDHGGNCTPVVNTACTTYGYDLARQLKTIAYSDPTTPDVTDVTYDTVGRRTGMVEAAGTSTWSWDSLGRLLSAADPGSGSVGYTWTLRDQVETISYAPGKVVTRHYDDAGRFDWVRDWNNKTTTFGYDQNGNHKTIGYPTTTATSDEFNFDRADRLVDTTTPAAKAIRYLRGGSEVASFSYGRRNGGQLSSSDQTGFPGGDEVYGYDANDRLCYVAGSGTGTCPAPPAGGSTYSYDNADNLTKYLDSTRAVFDPANQLCFTAPSGVTGGNCTTPGTPAGGTDFDYDSRGNRVKKQPPSGAATNYTYDQANRLTSVSQPNNPTNEGEFTAQTPSRLTDTRPGSGFCPGTCARLNPQSTLTLQVAGAAGVPASGVSAVALNVTVVSPSGTGYLTVFPSDLTTTPTTSNLNFDNGQTIANAAIVKVGSDGKIKVFNGSTVGQRGALDLLIDVQGWYMSASGASGTTFEPTNPGRIVDTRPGVDQDGLCPTSKSQCVVIPANSYREVQVTGQEGVPTSGVTAVALNVTVTGPSSLGHLRVYEAGIAPPNASNVQFLAGETRAELVVTKVSANGRIRIYNGSPGTANVFADVQGWYTSAPDGSPNVFAPITPTRVLNTTSSTGTCTPNCARMSAGSTKTVTLPSSGEAKPPPGASAVVVNVTAVAPSGTGWLAVWGNGDPQPLASNINYVAPNQTANAAFVKLNDDKFKIYVADSATDVIVDVVGFFTNVPTTATASYAYAPDGLRRAKTTSTAGTASMRWDRSGGLPMLLAETTNTSVSTYWIYGPGGLPVSQINPDGSTFYLRHDQLGSTRLVSNAAGDTVATFSFDPYGRPTGRTGTFETPFGYAGQYTDEETGFQYLRARYYDPATGQFLTVDPIAASTRERYGYVGGSPLNGTDPLGLCWGPTCLIEQVLEPVGAVASEAAGYAVGALDTYTDMVPGGSIAKWQWSHPDEHADVLQYLGNAASVVAIFGAATGNAPLAAVAGGVGATASACELVQGLRTGEDEHIVSGAVGLVTFGTGAGATRIAAELGGGKLANTIIEFYGAYFGYGSSDLVRG